MLGFKRVLDLVSEERIERFNFFNSNLVVMFWRLLARPLMFNRLRAI